MSKRLPLTVFFLTAGLTLCSVRVLSQSNLNSPVKVLSQLEAGFNVASIEALMRQGDRATSKGNLDQAREKYDQARDVAKKLLAFYRDLSGSFRGLDARIPREMDNKGRQSLVVLAKVNLRLAALFRRQDQPEVAVPLLVEVVRLMTPANAEGQKAYQALVELGFADTPYNAVKLRSMK